MNADWLLGKGQVDESGRESRWLDRGVALVVACLLIVFGLLKADHSRQLEATRRGIYVYSQSTPGAEQAAERIRSQTGLRALPLEHPETRETLRQLELNYAGPEPGLLLPSELGWIQVRDRQSIEEALAPLKGVPTPHLLGAFAALTLAALWVGGRMWHALLAYFGVLWPVLGIVALGIAAPRCSGCVLESEYWMPLATVVGMASLGVVLGILGLRAELPRSALAATAIIALTAGIGQGALLLAHPKFCVPCMAGGIAWVGIWCVARRATAVRSLRRVTFGKPIVMAALAAAAYFGLQHGQAAFARSIPTSEPDFRSVLGRPLTDFVKAGSSGASGLVVVELSRCGACDLAQKRLRQRGVAFRTVRYCGLLTGESCFRSDFEAVSPLFLIVDRQGRIQFAEAGWSEEPDQIEQFFDRITKQLGNQH